jgi:hypothetical protein
LPSNACADFPVATAGATLGDALEVADPDGLGAGAADDAALEHASAPIVSIAAAIAERAARLNA